MPRKPLEQRNIRKLTKVGNGKTYSVTLPIEMVRKLKWQQRQKVYPVGNCPTGVELELDEKRKRIIINYWK